MIRRVLANTEASLAEARRRREEQNERATQAGHAPRPSINEQLSYTIYFAKHFGSEIADALAEEFGSEYVRSGETLSDSAEGQKLVDVAYSTPQSGLGIMVSLKSVHQGEMDNGNSKFTHNLKRNDEELRVEATALHLRQPYAVLVATLILPFEACEDAWRQGAGGPSTSSFGRWVEKLWSLRGRTEPEDPPNLFELVSVALYARDGSDLGFYEVGGSIPCPRVGRPSSLLSFNEFIERIKERYYRRNKRDFSFEGE